MNDKVCTVKSSIAVLSLNPAVDMTYEIPFLLKNQKAHAVSMRYDPGGNGINVGRALKKLQIFADNYCVIAGEMGQLLQHLLTEELDAVDYEIVIGETRVNNTIIELSSEPSAVITQYEVSGIGPDIPEQQLNQLLDRFLDFDNDGIAVITGALQQSIPTTLYAELIDKVNLKGGRAIVDTHGETLKLAVKARPYLIKPNLHELEVLLNKPLQGIESIAFEARLLQRSGIEWVCVSLGDSGAILTNSENSYYVQSPQVEVVCSVGAGDSMVAALAASLACGHSADAALKLGVACATATVIQPGTVLFSSADMQTFYEKIQVMKLDI